MIRPSATRDRLNKIIAYYGVKITFIAKQLEWDYANLNKFKNGLVNISRVREEKLAEFLDRFDKQEQIG